MSGIRNLYKKKVVQYLLLFVYFHLFWYAFYTLSGANFIKLHLWHIYFKQSVINSLGFATFCIALFWLFPSFISHKRIAGLLAASILLIIGLGYIQYLLQDWYPKPFTFLQPAVANQAKKGFASPTLRQISGAPVRAMLNVLVYILLGLGYAYMRDWFVKDRRTKILEKEKIEAELMLLRYQLNPHFLFNTINDIYYLAIIKSDKTADAILKVSGLLRYVLNDKEEQVVLEKEIGYLKEFINLQQFRFPDQFIDFQEYTDKHACGLLIAPLLLITFVENAFKHGEPGTQEAPLQISLRVQEKILVYDVINKVNGRSPKDVTTGIGLVNLKRRLTLLYPGKYQLELKEENKTFHAHLQIHLS